MSAVSDFRFAVRQLVPAGWTLDRLACEAVDALAVQRGWSVMRACRNLRISYATYYRKRRATYPRPWCVRG